MEVAIKDSACQPLQIIKDIVSFINGKESLYDFAFGSGIPNHIVHKAIRDNDPLDTELTINDSVAQTLTGWWLSSNKPPLWKSNKIRQGFDLLGMPDVYCCIFTRNPTMDPDPTWGNIKNVTQSSAVQAQDGRPQQYLSLEYITLCLKLDELGLLTDLSELIDTPENSLALVMNTKMHEDTFAYICKEHRRFSLDNTLVQHRIAYHILAIWYILENGKSDKISLLRDFFYDTDLDDMCEEVMDKHPWTNPQRSNSNGRKGPSGGGKGNVTMGMCKSPGMAAIALSATCSSNNSFQSPGENREDVDLEEQVPELIAIDNEGASGSHSSGIVGQAKLSNMGDTTKIIGEPLNVQFEIVNTGDSGNMPPKSVPNPHVALKAVAFRNLDPNASSGDRLEAFSDKL